MQIMCHSLKTRNEVHLKSTKMTKLEEKAVGEEVLRRAHCSRMVRNGNFLGFLYSS